MALQAQSLSTFAMGANPGSLSGFDITGGVARPDSAVTRRQFAALQRAINAYMDKFLKLPPIQVDGILGLNTLTHAQIVASHVNQRADDAKVFIEGLEQMALDSRHLAETIAKLAGVSTDFSDPRGASRTAPSPTETAPRSGSSKTLRTIAGISLVGVGLFFVVRGF